MQLPISKEVCRLNDIDVVVQRSRETVLGRPYDLLAVFVTVLVVLGVEKLLDLPHWESHLEPVLGWAVLDVIFGDAMSFKPFMHAVAALLGRGTESLNILQGQVVAEARVTWVTDFVKLSLEFIELVLLQTNPKADEVVWVRSIQLRPLSRSVV